MKLNLKIFFNKTSGQPSVILPKKMFNQMPKTISIDIPNKYLKTDKEWWK
jgi:hypothetical protein